MICSLSKDDKNYSVYVKLYEYLAADYNRIMKSPDASVNVNDMMKQMYNDVAGKTGDHELGIRFARMVPTVLYNISAKDIENIGTAMTKGFDPTATARLAAVALDPVTGIEYVEKELGVSRNIINDVKDAAEAKPKKKRGRKKKEPTDLPGGQVSQDQLILFDENGDPIVADVSNEEPEEGVVYPDKAFEAVAPHALKDTDQEALSMDPTNKGYNVIDPAKKFFYSVKRAIVRMLAGSNRGSEINYPGVGPIYLRAQSRELLPADMLLPSTTPVVLVVVDQFGNPVKFNDNAEVDVNGKPAFYNLRNPYDIDGAYEKQRITAIQNTQKVSFEVAKDMIMKERAVVEKILDYVSKDISHTVGMEIDGGTLGTLGNAPNYYFLSSVNFPTDAVTIDMVNGQYFFNLPSISEGNIRLKQMTFAERPELVDMLADFMTEEVYAMGLKLDNKSKKNILERYVMLNSNTISMLDRGPRIMGEVLDLSTPELREAAKQKIKAAFNSLMPFGKPLTNAQINQRKSQGAKIVTSAEAANRGDILAIQDQGTGETIYRVLGYMTLNITQEGQNNGTHFSLSPREEGGFNQVIIPNGYFNSYIKNNFMIDKLLNADNQIVSLNSYFTFSPLPSETSKIDKVDEKKEEDEIDDFTKDLIAQNKKAQEAFDALPEATKQAIEILNDGDATMPASGISYSLHIVKTFTNNLKKNLYTREQAQAIFDALTSEAIREWVPFARTGQFNLKDSMQQYLQEDINKYTRPTKPELTGGSIAKPNIVSTNVNSEVEELFESNPELATVGTPEQYSEYLDTKDTPIVFHGSPEYFEEFDETRLGSYTNAPSAKEGIFFGGSRSVSKSYLDKRGQTLNVDKLLEMKPELKILDSDIVARYIIREEVEGYGEVISDVIVYKDGSVGVTKEFESDSFEYSNVSNVKDFDFSKVESPKVTQQKTIEKLEKDISFFEKKIKEAEGIEINEDDIFAETPDVERYKKIIEDDKKAIAKEKLKKLAPEPNYKALEKLTDPSKKKEIDQKKKFTKQYLSRVDELRNTYDENYGGYIDKDRSITDKPFEDLFIRPFTLNLKNPLIVSDEGKGYREESYLERIQKAKELGHDGVIIKDTYDSKFQTKPEDVYVVFKTNQIVPLGSKQDVEEFKAFVSISTEPTVEMKDPLDTTEPPPSTVEKKRRRTSRKADSSGNKTKKDNPSDPFLGRPTDEESDDVWNSRVIQLSGGKITQEDIDTAKAWYQKHPMSKHFSFREAFDMVNQQDSSSIATWSMNGIVLYKGSNYTQLYHEAFHGFTQAFMTPKQREALYSEVRKMTGTFKDYEGKMTPFKYATDKQVEEYLAEEFRQYMLSQGKMAIKSAPARKSFFKKLLDILEILFGNLTIADVMADGNANSEIKKVFDALRKGDMTDYNFQKPDARFNNTLNSTGIQALDEEATFSNLSKKDTKLLLDSIDGWIAQSINGANSDLQTEEALEDYLKLQVDLMMNRVSPAEMERRKLAKAPNLTYSQSANYLRSKAGRTQAYRRVEHLLSRLQLELDSEYRKLRTEGVDNNKLQDIREKLGLVMFARQNFGDLNNIENNVPDKDGVIRGVIAFHLAKSKDFGSQALELLDAEETPDEEKATRSEYADRSGAEISQKEIAKAEVKYLFKTIIKMDPKTMAPVVNELGAPVLMDSEEIWGKVSLILENELDVINMYNKLVKYAQQTKQNEMTMAITQLINKLGPRGLDVGEFKHLNSRAVENLWTNFRNVFNMRRVPLVAMNVEVKEGKVKSTIGRGINPYAAVGKSWNSNFAWDKTNEFAEYDEATGITSLNVNKLLKKYPDVESLKTKGKYDINKVFAFLNAIGIKMSDTEEVRYALEFGSPELGVSAGKNGFRWVETLLVRNKDRVLNDPLNKDKSGGKLDPWNTKGMSLLEIIAKNGVIITKPQDIFEATKMKLLAGTTVIGGVEQDAYISSLPGEGGNWLELQQIEGQYGAGLPSFMVTTADGNTKFEHSLNSSMSIMVSSVNSVEDTMEPDEEGNMIRVSAYENLIRMPHMAKFDIEKNPNAKRYVWLTNMFNIVDSDGNLISKDDKDYGSRKTATGGKIVKLELFDVSGAREVNKEGVSSAAADPYTKFILDLHLSVQKGLPELMRHSDKSTSYAVILNYITSPDALSTGDVTQGQYVPNWRFASTREQFHMRAFNHYILPNLISEHDRVRRFMQKKKDVDNILKQIAKEKKEGMQITPTPVFDFNYLAQGQKFLTFEGILNSSTKDKLSKVEGDLGAYFANTTDEKAQKLKQEVIDQTKDYFEGQYKEVKAEYDKFGFVADNLLDNLAVQIADKTDAGYIDPKKSKSRLENILLNSWVYNSWIHNVESMNFLYGDIAQYNHMKEEFHKRNAGIASTGTGYRTDEDWLRFVNDSERGLGRKFEEQLTGLPMRAYDGTMNTGVMRDKITRSAYLEEIGYNLYKQMVDNAVLANSSAAVKRSVKQIETDVKTKLFGAVNADRDITSIDSIKGIEPAGKSIMANYAKMNEADAQGWISFDAYRILMDSQGEWTPAQEKIYLALLRGENIPAEKIGTFFPPIKAQYWGALANIGDNPLTSDVTIEAFHKFQLTPIIPSVANLSPKLKSLHEKMMREGIDYALFESGSKIGTLTTVQFDDAGKPIRMTKDGKVVRSTDAEYVGAEGQKKYDKLDVAPIKDDIYTQDRTINEDVPFTVNKIHVEYLKNQLKIEPKWKGKVTIPTQIRKLIEVDLMENGIPTDFLVGEVLETRIDKWLAMSFDEQMDASENFRDLIEYEQSLAKLTQVKKAQLLKKAKLKLNSDGELVGDMTNLVKYVKSQLSNQELADHELDFINTDFEGKLKHDLSFSLAADKIERLLNALVVKALIRQKTNGEALIQVAGAMLEPATEELIAQYGGTNGLTYYKINPKTGRVDAMKVKIAMQGDFEKLLYLPDVSVFRDATDDQGNVVTRKGKPVRELDYNASLANLNRLIKDDNWLDQGNNRKMITMHGDRIPIQGLNSDEFAEVYEFLPKEAGNIVILPAEIVAKSGGDFDIDKITWMMPSIGMSTSTIDGETTYSVGLYESIPEEQYKQRYKEYKEAFAKKYLTDSYETKADKEKALALHFQGFGGKEKVYSEVISLALEEGDLLSFEEFVLADQEKVAQNQMLFALNKLSSRVQNYMNLVRPNGTDILDPIVDDLKLTYRNYNPGISTNDEDAPAKGIQANRIFEITYNLYKQMTNNLGKKALGIGAVDNTYNELFNRIGLYLSPNNKNINGEYESEEMQEIINLAREFYKQEKIKKDKFIDSKDTRTKEEQEAYKAADRAYKKDMRKVFMSYERQTLYLPHNTLGVKGYKDKAISFSHRYDALGQNKIGDVISQLMNGWVDIAKDPWIFYLRGNDKLGPMLLFLVQAGVPVEYAGNFISQPIIEEYMETVDRLQSVMSSAMDEEDPEKEKITRDKAILAAKEMILEKLGITVEGETSENRVRNLKEVIKRETLLTAPKDGQFKLDELTGQLEYVFTKYPKVDKKGRPKSIEERNINYNDPAISDFQKAVFLHFIEMTDMERAVKDIKLRTNVDTGKSGSLYEAQDKIVKLMELKRNRIDDVKGSQMRYWRLPSDVIDRLIPTIKDKDGNDTGILDETKISSPIASFYQQPFQIAVWKDLFAFRNNPVINRFMIDLSFSRKDKAKNKTYFTDDIELMTEFKNSLLPILFQNSFLTFDVSDLENPKEPIYYRGSEVSIATEKVIALPKYGAAYVNGIMYYDYATLWEQFQSKAYTKSSDELGIPAVGEISTFTNFGEYVKFIFEREYLRGEFAQDTFAKMEALRKSDEDFNLIWKASARVISKDKYLGEGETILRTEARRDYNRDRLKYAFEIYLRNKALKNVYNMHAIFNGETAFAYDIVKHKVNEKYGQQLVDKFTVLKNLVPDSETTKGTDTERVNLAFIDSPKDKETLDSYYFQLQSLANEVALVKAIPDLSPDEAYQIAETFRKLPIIAFLQSGMNTNGRFSLTRVVDNSIVETILLPEVDKFLSKISSEETDGKNTTLNAMFDAFEQANARYDARGKNYVMPTDRSNKPTSLLEQRLFIQETGTEKTFDPAFINPKGEIVKPYVRIGDKVTFTRTLGERINSYSNAEVSNISWDKTQIVIDVEVTLSNGTTAIHKFFYLPTGELVKYVDPSNNTYLKNLDTIINTEGTMKVRMEMLAELPEFATGENSKPGDKIIYKMEYIKDGEPIISIVEADILEVEDLGYNYQNGPDGTLVYTSEVPIYRIKLTYDKTFDDVTTTRTVHNIIDANGNIIANINDKGQGYPVYSDNKMYVNLKSDRVKGQYAVPNEATAKEMVKRGIIMPGAIVDVIEVPAGATPATGLMRRSKLMYLDASDMQLKDLEQVYTGAKKEAVGFNIDATNYFTVFNEAVEPGASVAATRASAVPLPKGSGVGNIDLRDRFIFHSGFQNKAGVMSRLKYGGGSLVEFMTDAEEGGVRPEVRKAIDESIENIKKMRDEKGLQPVFSKAGYGQYMIGANDTTGKMFTDEAGNKIGVAVAPETFKYLSTRLLEEFGYINPNFVKEAEGVAEVVRVAQQPITDEEYHDLMNKCFV